MAMQTFLPPSGGYRKLRAYRMAVIIYDASYYFAHSYLSRGDRTIDQMLQAARSGKQNIAEGSEASATSKEMEIKLTNVAKASLEELLLDYEDFLRVRGLCQWTEEHPRYQAMRRYLASPSFERTYQSLLIRLSPEELANLVITLIHQTTYLLRRLIERQQDSFLRHGGIKEQMLSARLAYRSKQRGG